MTSDYQRRPPPDAPVKLPPSTRSESPFNLLLGIGLLVIGLMVIVRTFGWL